MSLALPSCSEGKCWNVTCPLVALVTSSMNGFATSSWMTWPAGRLSARRSVIFSCATAGIVPAARRAAARATRWSRRTIMRFSSVSFLSVTHLDRQPQDDLRPDHQNGDREQMGDEVRKYAVKYFGHRPPRIARHHE